MTPDKSQRSTLIQYVKHPLRNTARGGVMADSSQITPSFSLIDRMITLDRTPVAAPMRPAFAFEAGRGGGQLIRSSASTPEQAMVVSIQSMLARAEAQRAADLKSLREEMQTMQTKSNALITATVTAGINAALDSDAFMTRMAMAAQAVILATKKDSLSAQHAPASGQGNPLPQSGEKH